MAQTAIIAHVLELPETAQGLWTVSYDPCLLAKLSLTQRRLHALISSARFAACVVEELSSQGVPWARSCTDLKEVSLGMAVSRICARDSKNHLYFPYGGGTQVLPATMPLLDDAAQLAQRYPLIHFSINSHVGAAAPAGIATAVSQRRGRAVMQELVERGVAEDRISVTAWGRRVSMMWSEPEIERAARAELFFSLGDVQFPLRAAYYDSVPSDQRPPVGLEEASSSSSDDESGGRVVFRQFADSDDEASHQVQMPNGQITSIAFLRQLLRLRRVIQVDGESDDEEEDAAQL